MKESFDICLLKAHDATMLRSAGLGWRGGMVDSADGRYWQNAPFDGLLRYLRGQ